MSNAEHDRIARVERQLAAAQQITHIGSWEWDVATNVVTWSDELYRIYGFEPQSRPITFEFFVSRLHPDDRARVQHEVRAAMENGARFAYPERIVRPDGSVRALDTVGEVARGADGRPVRLIGTCRDVTEERARDETIQLHADIVKNVQIALSVWEVGDPGDPATLRLLSCNPAAERASRRTLTASAGMPFREILPYAADGAVERMLLEVARDGRVRDVALDRSRNPANPARAISAKAFPLAGGRVGLAVEDVTEAMRARRLQDAEHVVLEKIASGADLSEVLECIVDAIEEHSPPMLASVLLLDEEGKHLHHGAARSLPPAYAQAIDGAEIGPSAGSCGTAAWRRAPVYVADVETDPLWVDYRDLARAHGLRSCWSTPILAKDGRVLGTFALYDRQPRMPTPADLQLLDRATHLARIAIEHAQLEDQLRALSARAESVREDERTGIAREIHDVLGQALTALKMDLAWLGRRLPEQSAAAAPLVEKVLAMSVMTDEVIGQVRRISAELRPGALDDLGLVAAVEWQAQQFEERTGTPCVVESDLGDAPVGRELSTAVFRIFQEALTNVVRHAHARHVEVRLNRDGDDVRLEVLDDGRGIAPEALGDPKSLGLLGIRERARRFGGAVTIGPRPQGGTVVSLRVPLAGRRRAS